MSSERARHDAPIDPSRRDFLVTVTVGPLAVLSTQAMSPGVPQTIAPQTHAAAETLDVTLVLNGREQRLSIDPRTTLLDALREQLHLKGARKGCDHGQCGACTVHVDGRRVLSCLTLAATLEGRTVTTIEGIASDDRLHPLQQAFIDHDAFQCGYCTSGQIMSGLALLQEPCGPADADVRECMSGNLCRCGAYAGIVGAVQSVRRGPAGG